MLVAALAALAAPQFQTLPGTPADLVANAQTNQPAVVAPPPAAEKTPVPANVELTATGAKPPVHVKPVALEMSVAPIPTPVAEKASVAAPATVVVKPAAPPRRAPPAGFDPAGGFSVIKPEKTKPARPVTKLVATSTNVTSHRTPLAAQPSGSISDPIVMGATPTAAAAAPAAATAKAPVAPPVVEPVVVPAVALAPAPAPEAPKIPAPALAETAAKPVVPVVTEATAPVAPPIPVPAIPAPVAAAKVEPKAEPPAPAVVAPVVVVPSAVAAPPAALIPPAPPAIVIPPPSARIPGSKNPLAGTPFGGTSAARTAPTPPAPSFGARVTAENANEIIPAGMIRFQAAPLEQVLDFYSEMVGRTMLRPASLPAASITLKTQSELTRTEAMQALDAVLGMNGIAMLPVGQKFIKVVPIAQANQEAAPLNMADSAELPDLGQYITHVVQLKYSKPSELTQVLTPFAKVPNSILPIDGNQMLILRDYTENVKRMLELIEKIDVAIPSEFVSEVIPIKYALAADISSALSSIGGGGGGGTTSSSANRGTTGRTLAGSQNTLQGGNQNNQNNRNYNPNNPQGNVGNTGAGGIGGAAGAQTSFASRLQNIIQRASATGADIQLIGPNKIIADERTNSLLVFATREDMATIKDIISKLDVVLAQVLIEAIVLDVSMGDDFSLGVSGGQRPKNIGSSALGGSFNNPNGANGFLNQLISAGTNGLLTPATSINYPATGGLSYFGRLNQSWDFTLAALAGNTDAKILARPRIQTSHAVPASIFIGETRPYVTGTYFDGYSGGGSRSQYQQTQIGISLNVLPLINTEGLVVMDIQEQVSQASDKGGGVIIDGNEVPITQDQNASAKVAVRSGETIVLGGFVRNTKGASKSGVPFLMDIPLLGSLFRSTTSSEKRRELLVLIRPTVLATPEIAALQSQIERNRLPGIRQAESEFNESQVKAMKKASKLKAADPEEQFRLSQAAQAAVTNEPPTQLSAPAAKKSYKRGDVR